jgi:DNA-binding HxlR family transcriptional regulator
MMDDDFCPTEAALEVMGGKWKGMILFYLHDETRRFNELRRLMPGITQRMLTRQLRELEEDGVVCRKVYPQVPPKVEYSLSEKGKKLGPVLRALRQWGQEFAKGR